MLIFWLVHLRKAAQNIYNKFNISLLLALIGSSNISWAQREGKRDESRGKFEVVSTLNDPSSSVM